MTDPGFDRPTGADHPLGRLPAPREDTNVLGTLSLVFAFVFAPAGVVLGHLGLRQIRRNGQRGHDRALVGLMLSYVMTAVAVVALVIWAASAGTPTAPSTVASSSATATPTPAPPTEDAAALLLPLDEIKAITGNPELFEAGTTVTPGMPPPEAATFEPARCFPSIGAGAPQPYQDSGFRAYYAKNYVQRPTLSLQVDEAVAIFDDAAAAQKALAGYIERWRQCANKRLQWSHVAHGEFSMWTLGAPEDAGEGVTALRSINDASPVSVTRAIGTKDNVLVDIWILGSGVTDQAATIAKRIG